ncbi:MAG: hypothetical protein QM737_02805 [Ferruginibacter sp.]
MNQPKPYIKFLERYDKFRKKDTRIKKLATKTAAIDFEWFYDLQMKKAVNLFDETGDSINRTP